VASFICNMDDEAGALLSSFQERVVQLRRSVEHVLQRRVPLFESQLIPIVEMPADELKGADFFSWLEEDKTRASLALHRDDDVALVTWQDIYKQHSLSVYDAAEGDVKAVEHYKVEIFRVFWSQFTMILAWCSSCAFERRVEQRANRSEQRG